MKYRFEPVESPPVVVDTERQLATFDNGRTVDLVGGEFAFDEATRFKFRGPYRLQGEIYAVLSIDYGRYLDIYLGDEVP